MIREGYIITFENDFVHHVFASWSHAANKLVDIGYAVMQGQTIMIAEGYDIEKVTIH